MGNYSLSAFVAKHFLSHILSSIPSKFEMIRVKIDDFRSLQRCAILLSKWSREWARLSPNSLSVTSFECQTFANALKFYGKQGVLTTLIRSTSKAIPVSLSLAFISFRPTELIFWHLNGVSGSCCDILAAQFEYQFWGQNSTTLKVSKIINMQKNFASQAIEKDIFWRV